MGMRENPRNIQKTNTKTKEKIPRLVEINKNRGRLFSGVRKHRKHAGVLV